MLKIISKLMKVIIIICLFTLVWCQTDDLIDDTDVTDEPEQVPAQDNINDTIGYDDSFSHQTTDQIETDENSDQNGYIQDNSTDTSAENDSDTNYDITPQNQNDSTSGIYYSLDEQVDTLDLPNGNKLPKFNNASSRKSRMISSLRKNIIPSQGNYQVALYVIQMVGSNSPSVPCYFDQKSMTFQGCNVNQIGYNARSSGVFRAGKSVPRTKKSCSYNIDNQFINAVSKSNGFQKSPQGFYLTQGGKQTVRVIGPLNQQKRVSKKPAASSFMKNIPQGNYKFSLVGSNLPPVNALVGSKGLSLNGCNSLGMLATLGGNGVFKAGKAVGSSKRQCKTNNDMKYVQAIQGGNSIVKEGNNFSVTKNGKKIGSFQLVKPNQRTTMSFNLNKQQLFKPGRGLQQSKLVNSRTSTLGKSSSIFGKPGVSFVNKPNVAKSLIQTKALVSGVSSKGKPAVIGKPVVRGTQSSIGVPSLRGTQSNIGKPSVISTVSPLPKLPKMPKQGFQSSGIVKSIPGKPLISSPIKGKQSQTILLTPPIIINKSNGGQGCGSCAAQAGQSKY